MAQQQANRHGSEQRHRTHAWIAIVATVVALMLAVGAIWWAWAHHAHTPRPQATTPALTATPSVTPSGSPSGAAPTASPSPTAADRAQEIVDGMSLDERAAQLVMTPLAAGTDPSAIRALIADEHVGSVILMGNWTSGAAGVREATEMLQSYADGPTRVLVATDQEGGQVQHLQGPGFETMPSEVTQGMMTLANLQAASRGWGEQLHMAGVHVDLAPCVDTVTIDRASNAPVGALDRDYGLDAAGNAQHAAAFVEGLRAAGVGAAAKHFPGLGAVTGNTDFTTDGIVDTTTTRNGPEVQAFAQAIRAAEPGMVMISLATYTAIDPDEPAAFSPTVIDGMLRGDIGYGGVVISDSLSASAVSAIAPAELGVRLVQAGGDLACVNDPAFTQPILDGLRARARGDAAFAERVTQSARRVVALKLALGLAQ